MPDLNKDLEEVTEEQGRIKDATPMLFGLDQVAKNHVEAIQALKKATKGGNQRSCFVCQGHPAPRTHSTAVATGTMEEAASTHTIRGR